MTNYYATINGRGCHDLNTEISNIKCPICGQKMDIARIGLDGPHYDAVSREYDGRGHLIQLEKWSTTIPIKWVCMYCSAELTATAKKYRETSIDLDAEL